MNVMNEKYKSLITLSLFFFAKGVPHGTASQYPRIQVQTGPSNLR